MVGERRRAGDLARRPSWFRLGVPGAERGGERWPPARRRSWLCFGGAGRARARAASRATSVAEDGLYSPCASPDIVPSERGNPLACREHAGRVRAQERDYERTSSLVGRRAFERARATKRAGKVAAAARTVDRGVIAGQVSPSAVRWRRGKGENEER